MPAADALAHKVRWVDDHDSNRGRVYLSAFMQDLTQDSTFNPIEADSQLLDIDGLLRSVRASEVYYLAPLMNDLVTAAATSLPNDDQILATDAPTPMGWLWLPQPIAVLDIRRHRMRFWAVHWRRRAGGYDMFWLSHRDDPEDDISANIRSWRKGGWLPTLQLSTVGRLTDNEVMPESITWPESARVDPLTHVDLQYEDVTDEDGNTGRQLTWHTHEGTELAPGNPSIGPDTMTRFIVATWRLMQQTLTTVAVEEPAHKGLRRDAKRANIPDTRVSVVDLRRRESHGDGMTHVEWSHRWITRGHWRRQPYKDPDTGGVVHRTIWIAAYVKGPEDKPLLVRDKVYALVR